MEMAMAKKVNKAVVKEFKFRGWDWSEIFDAANQEFQFKPKLRCSPKSFTLSGVGTRSILSIEDEEIFQQKQLKRLSDWTWKCQENQDKAEKLFRRFFEAFLPMEKKLHYHYQMWLGLSKVKHQETFLKYCFVLFFFMWN